MQKEIKEKFFENPMNQTCFDCDKKDPEWVSVNNAVFLCKECQVKHRSYGVSISYIRSLEMDIWKEDQINLLKLGGNERLRELMNLYKVKINHDRTQLYFSKLLDYHRKLLKAELKEDIRPQPPNDDECLIVLEKEGGNFDNTSLNKNENDNDNNININEFDQDFTVENNSTKKTNDNQSILGQVTTLGYGLWSKTKDVASNVKNKIDETGIIDTTLSKTTIIAEKVKETGNYALQEAQKKGNYVKDKLVESTAIVKEKTVELGKMGLELTNSKIEEVVIF